MTVQWKAAAGEPGQHLVGRADGKPAHALDIWAARISAVVDDVRRRLSREGAFDALEVGDDREPAFRPSTVAPQLRLG